MYSDILENKCPDPKMFGRIAVDHVLCNTKNKGHAVCVAFAVSIRDVN
jgi:hypothetical protein